MFGKKKAKNSDKIGLPRLLQWQSSTISQSCNVLALGYFQIYCTDTLYLDPQKLGILLILSKIFDAVTDLCAGYIVDHTNTRWGRGRPYELAHIGLWLCTWLMFSCPSEWSTTIKYIWVFLLYTTINGVFLTLLNANDVVYMVRAFNHQQIVRLNSYGGIITSIAAVVFNILFPTMVATITPQAGGWSKLFAIFAIPLTLISLIRFLTVKEIYQVDVSAQKEQPKFKDSMKALVQNQYLLVVAAILLCINFVTNMGIGVYYYKYIVGNIGLQSIASVLMVVVLPIMFVFPKLSKKISITRLMAMGYCFSVAGGIIVFLSGGKLVPLMIGSVVSAMGSAPTSYLFPVLQIALADYNEWKGHERMEGTMGSVIGFAKRVGGTVGAGVGGIALGLAGYDAALAVIPDSALTLIAVLNSLVPAVIYAVAAIIMYRMGLDKQLPKIQKDLAEMRAAEAASVQADAPQ